MQQDKRFGFFPSQNAPRPVWRCTTAARCSNCNTSIGAKTATDGRCRGTLFGDENRHSNGYGKTCIKLRHYRGTRGVSTRQTGGKNYGKYCVAGRTASYLYEAVLRRPRRYNTSFAAVTSRTHSKIVNTYIHNIIY